MGERSFIRMESKEGEMPESVQLTKEAWTRLYGPMWLRVAIVMWLVAGSGYLLFQREWLAGAAGLAMAALVAARIRVQGRL